VNMPGFTAEAALYKTSGHYHLTETHDAGEGGQKIQPQLPPFWDRLRCTLRCGWDTGWWYDCFRDCFGIDDDD